MTYDKNRILGGLTGIMIITVVEIVALCKGFNGTTLRIYYASAGFILAGILNFKFPKLGG